MRQERWLRLTRILVILLMPVFLTTSSIRLVTSHTLLGWEHSRPGFPADPYGLPTEERIRLADVCIDYLVTNADISLLGDLQLGNGEAAFQGVELDHMVDVQVVYHWMVAVCVASGLLIVAGTILTARRSSRLDALKVLLDGGLLTIGLIVVFGLIMVFSWKVFFDGFHRTFFTEGTWTFFWSDTLIRLFPTRFWQDVAAAVVCLITSGALLISLSSWLWLRRIGRSMATESDVIPAGET